MNSSNQTLKTWDKHAVAYRDKFMMFDLYDDTYKYFCNLIDTSTPEIFEIACGPGNITRFLLKNIKSCKIKAIDFAPKMVDLANEINPHAEFEVMDCRKIDVLQHKYDAIVCGFCMPYLTKEECIKLIQDSSNLLKVNGVFYFSLLSGNYQDSKQELSSDGKSSMFVYVHEHGYIKEALQNAKLNLLKLFIKNYQKADGTSEQHLIFITRLIA
jgi:trans-aconitate methyltransferase